MALGPRIGQGKTAEVFHWEHNKIIKLFRSRRFDALLEAEWKLSRTVQELKLAVPAVYGVETVDGKKGIVYERIDGLTLTRQLSKKPWQLNKLARLMASQHFELGCRPGEGLPLQKQLLEYNITHAPQLTEEQKSAVIRYLRQLPDGGQACHGDFHPDNVMLSSKGPVIIDWTTGSCGQPIADVARTILILEYAELPASMPRLIRTLLTVLRRKLKQEYTSAYLALSGHSLEDIRMWTLPLAAARLIEGVTGEEERRLLRLVQERISAEQPVV